MRVTVSGLIAGCEVTIDQQRFLCLSEANFVREDGTPSKLLIWQSACPLCGAPVIFATPSRGQTWFNRRCPDHRQPGRPVFKRLRRTA